MAKRMKIVVGNWKMNPANLEEAKRIYKGIRRKTTSIKNVRTVVCPPTIFLGELSKFDRVRSLGLGVQNVFYAEEGAFTGEISPEMVRETGANFVIVGHSERRVLGESDDVVNKKIISAMAAGLIVIFCIGEKERDHDGHYLAFLREQIKSGLHGVLNRNLSQLIIAYEPVWAIGKSEAEAMKGRDVHEMAIFIKKTMAEMYPAEETVKVPVLYGGSVTPSNTEDIVAEGRIDGLLVGRQSLFADGFADIVKIVDGIK